MTNRILCPFHEESTPSCVIYDDSYFCFGCSKTGHVRELGISLGDMQKEPPEDLEASLGRINALPVSNIRGLRLPTDPNFYYIVWPNGGYYKKRTKVGGPAKYQCPRGHVKPLFEASVKGRKTLAIVEGELNAMSLAACDPPFDVVSPGGATEFTSKKYLQFYTKYDIFIIIADADAAGLKAAASLKTLLLKRTPRVTIHLMEQDANDVLVERGVSGVQLYVQEQIVPHA